MASTTVCDRQQLPATEGLSGFGLVIGFGKGGGHCGRLDKFLVG